MDAIARIRMMTGRQRKTRKELHKTNDRCNVCRNFRLEIAYEQAERDRQ